MNKSNVFTIAHKIARATNKKGDNYAVTFAAALKLVHNRDETSVFLNVKIGASLSVAVVKCSAEAASGSKHIMLKDLGNGYYAIGFKNGYRHIVSAALQADAEKREQLAVAPVTRSYSSRKIVTLEYAQLMGLEHGKSWVCTEYHVELKGACPSFEGQLICYAYTA